MKAKTKLIVEINGRQIILLTNSTDTEITRAMMNHVEYISILVGLDQNGFNAETPAEIVSFSLMPVLLADIVNVLSVDYCSQKTRRKS